MRLSSVFFITCLFFYIPFQAMAWGMQGHRIVGEIASLHLNSKATAEIQKILGNESIAMSSNWADFIKSDSSYRYLNSWHYVDFEKGISQDEMKEALKQDTGANAYNRLNFLIRELKKKTLSKEKKLMYLRLLIHIVGDLHQPLHVSPHGTSGGNDIRLSWFGQSSNLHRVWDEHLIEYQQLSYTEYVKAINFSSAAQRRQWQQQPITQWLYDSYTISQRLHNELQEPNIRLSYSYNFKHVETLNSQLLKGGIRLAGLLNELFGK